ncbi:protein of unknown function [Terribacillus halophilus]|uniref:DUF3899 domain-containing protein n=1 Tax=Terribacillus halophilus TaxID=361279 RepID=A0A1G6L569_9BACI|nr:DUF3899 domain-containing protein [Terribacillus halophilus]SDC38278.1 protein of unknown function [Terribacillus halophilus]
MKWKVSLFFITILGWYIATFVAPFSLADVSNIAFLIGLILIIIAAIALILHTGFLTPLIQGFQIIGERVVRKSRSAERADSQIKDDPNMKAFKANLAARITQSTFIVGSSSILTSVIIIFML